MEVSIYNPHYIPRPGAQGGPGGSGPVRPAEPGRPAAEDASGPSRAGAARGPDRGEQAEPANRPDPQEQRRIRQLETRDRQVRAHEAAHLTAAGPHAEGGARLQYRQGPDNRLYAVGGEVQLDTSRPEEPEETLDKAETLVQAALAPAEPSSQDLQVAAQARAMAAEARAELQRERSGDEGGRSRSSDAAYRQAAEGHPADPSGVRLDRMI